MDEPKEEPEEVIIKVDSPEKWTEASEIMKVCNVDTLTGVAQFEVKCWTSKQHRAMLDLIVDPEAPMETNARGVPTANMEDKNYLMATAENQFRRMVYAVDQCVMEMPGASLEEKSQWAAENLWHRDQLRQLYNHVISVAGFSRPTIQIPTGVPKIFRDAKSWADASRQPQELLFKREKETLAFTVRPISRQVSQQIDLACPEPEVPSIPAPGRQAVNKRFVKNEKDPRYLAAVEAVENKRKVLILEASLEWKLPGDSFEQKTEWLVKRPAGEVRFLSTEITGTINKFQRRSDFM